MYLITRTRFGSFVAVVLTLAVAVLGIAYFGSNVYKTKIDNSIRSHTEWTPENVIKDPEAYLDYRSQETKTALVKLNTSGFSIIQKRSKLESQQSELAQKVDLGNQSLTNLKKLYKTAESNHNFPFTWEDYNLDKDQAQKQIIKLDHELTGYTKLLAQYNTAVTKLQAQEEKLVEARTLAQEQLLKIDLNRESLKIQGITTDLKDSLLQLKSILDTPLFAAENPHGLASLDDLMSNRKETINSDEFKSILMK